MLNEYKKHEQERAEQNIPPLPLDPDQTSQLVDLLKSNHDESDLLIHLLKERVPAGVDQSAYVKAAFLADGLLVSAGCDGTMAIWSIA